jgi:tRNA-dihydrouridine synthase A
VPVTVKCRIGVDEHDSYDALQKFIALVSGAGCQVFIIHARKAWLQGLSPKQNREIPLLRYDIVKQIKQDFPHLTIILNGGIQSSRDIADHLPFVDGVMIGREAYQNPYFLEEIDRNYFSGKQADKTTRHAIIEKFVPYIEEQLRNSVPLSRMTRHILGLFQGQAGARAWRRYLSEHAYKSGAGIEILKEALQHVRNA